MAVLLIGIIAAPVGVRAAETYDLTILSGLATPASAQVTDGELATIGMPDETRRAIGTLRAVNGVPTAETGELVYDYVDRMRGVQAFIGNQGAASMYGCLRGYASLGATKANRIELVT